MTVFISCSGSLSLSVGKLLHSWIQDVIQGVKPWLYTEDIDKGALWPEEVDKALATTVGILCVTEENKNAPWILFEAGGLWKGLSKARVSPLLIDLQSQDIKQPLARFTFTLPNKHDIWQLLKMINSADPEKELPEQQLQRFFDRMWPDFEKGFHEIREAHKKEAKPAPRPLDDMVVEILNITRGLQRNSEEILHGLPKTLNVLGVPGTGYSGYSGSSGLVPSVENQSVEKRAFAYYLAALRSHGEDLEKQASGGSFKKPAEKPPEKPAEKPPEKPPDKPG
jgi:hypothetical protein